MLDLAKTFPGTDIIIGHKTSWKEEDVIGTILSSWVIETNETLPDGTSIESPTLVAELFVDDTGKKLLEDNSASVSIAYKIRKKKSNIKVNGGIVSDVVEEAVPTHLATLLPGDLGRYNVSNIPAMRLNSETGLEEEYNTSLCRVQFDDLQNLLDNNTKGVLNVINPAPLNSNNIDMLGFKNKEAESGSTKDAGKEAKEVLYELSEERKNALKEAVGGNEEILPQVTKFVEEIISAEKQKGNSTTSISTQELERFNADDDNDDDDDYRTMRRKNEDERINVQRKHEDDEEKEKDEEKRKNMRRKNEDERKNLARKHSDDEREYRKNRKNSQTKEERTNSENAKIPSQEFIQESINKSITEAMNKMYLKTEHREHSESEKTPPSLERLVSVFKKVN